MSICMDKNSTYQVLQKNLGQSLRAHMFCWLVHIEKYKLTHKPNLEFDPHFKYKMRKGNPKTHQNSSQSTYFQNFYGWGGHAQDGGALCVPPYPPPTSKSCMTPWHCAPIHTDNTLYCVQRLCSSKSGHYTHIFPHQSSIPVTGLL